MTTNIHVLPAKQAWEKGYAAKLHELYMKNPATLTSMSWFKFEVLLKHPAYFIAFIDTEKPFFIVFSKQSKHIETVYPVLETQEQVTKFREFIHRQDIKQVLMPQPEPEIQETLEEYLVIKRQFRKYVFTLQSDVHLDSISEYTREENIENRIRYIEELRGKGSNEADSFTEYIMNTPNLTMNAVKILDKHDTQAYVVPQYDPEVKEGYLDWVYYSKNTTNNELRELLERVMYSLFKEGAQFVTVTVPVLDSQLHDVLNELRPSQMQVFLDYLTK